MTNHTFAPLDFVFVCVQCLFVYLLFVYLQICVFAVGHVRLLLGSAVSSHSLVEAPLIRFLYNIRSKKNENIVKTEKSIMSNNYILYIISVISVYIHLYIVGH